MQIPYGHSQVDFSLPPSIAPDWIEPIETPGVPDPLDCVRQALDRPVAGRGLESFGAPRSAAVAVNDKTRPVPHEALLPPLLERLERLGIPPERITLVIASGTHAPMPAGEYPKILPAEILRRYRVISHDCDDDPNLVDLGITHRGTPVRANRVFMDADLRIVVGNMDPHHFMGFSGGAKTAAVGLTSRETINRNHAMLPDPHARTGEYASNPMRMDVEEIGQLMGLDYAVNAILNMHKEIVQVFAGDPLDVMQAGIPVVQQVCQVPVSHAYDLVIASPGGYPKDINFYQSQKALTHAALLARPGGQIILAAACPEGVGSPGYERWMQGMTSFEDVLSRFTSEGFQVGPHKAFLVARIASQVNVQLVSEIDPAKVRQLLLEPAASLPGAVERALGVLGTQPRLAILPRGTSTVPLVM